MKVARLCLLLLLAGMLVQAQTAWAEGWSLGNLVPFAKSNKGKSAGKKGNQPSAMQQLGNGTKKVVGTTTDLVTLKWLSSNKKKPPEPESKWARRSRKKEPPKKSFFDFLFPPKEPPPPQTLGEWMSQRRLDP